MPNSMKYYPSVSDLVNQGVIPGEIEFIEDFIEDLLDEVRYKNLVNNRSPYGDIRNYYITLVLKEIAIDFFNLGPKIIFFAGTPGETNIPLSIQTQWTIKRYLDSFNVRSFDYSLQGFFDILLEVAGVSKAEFINQLVSIFINDTKPYLNLVGELIDTIDKYDKGLITIKDDGGEIISNSTQILSKLDQLKLDIEDPSQMINPFEDEISHIIDSFDDISQTLNINFDIFQVTFEAIKKDLATIDEQFGRLLTLFRIWLGKLTLPQLKQVLIPNFSISLEDIDIALEFPRKWLLPVNADNEVIDDDPSIPEAQKQKSRLTFSVGRMQYSTKTGFKFEKENSFTFNKSQIGKTGLIIEFSNLKLDLSPKKHSIPEAQSAGYPPDFMGAYVEHAAITLPEKWFKNQDQTTARVVGKDLLIGTGGISGTLALEATGTPPEPDEPVALTVNLGKSDGFKLGFQSFDLTFRQNAIIESNVKGYLQFPDGGGFTIKDNNGDPARLDIDIHFGQDGDFNITFTEQQGIKVLGIPEVLDIVINSLSVGREEDRFFLAVSGKLDFADQTSSSNFIKDNLPKDIDIQELIIWSDGKIEFRGGGLKLRKPFTLKLGPAKISVTKLHLGTHEQMHNGVLRQYRFFGFDGGLSVKPGLIDARGDSITFSFSSDGLAPHRFVRIQSLAIDIMIPGDEDPKKAAVILNGYLAMREPQNEDLPGAGTEYAGGVDFSLPKLKMAGSAKMRYNPDVPSFLIDIGLEIPTPIPLGPTGLGIYGFRALLGQRYIASKRAAGLSNEDPWYEYYKVKVPDEYRVGIQPGKFEQRKGFSLGAGVSLGTSGDSGKIFSAKVFFLLSLREVFLIEGQGQVMKKRIGLDDPNDPPFYAFIAITSKSVETALGVDYRIPDTGNKAGQIVTLSGVIEIGFFFGNAQGWYVNIGREFPEHKRIRARILDLLDCYFFLMISSSGIRLGAGASYELDKKFGPFGVELKAYVDILAFMSVQPKQIGGSLDLGGGVKLKIFGLKFGFSVDFGLAGESPDPYTVTGKVKICVRVFAKDRCARIKLTWTKSKQPNLEMIPILSGSGFAKARNIMSDEAFDLRIDPGPLLAYGNIKDADIPTIPVDSFIDVEFQQPVNAGSTSGMFLNAYQGNEYSVLIPPEKGKTSQVRHTFSVDEVNIWARDVDGAGWEPYHAHEALTAYAASEFEDAFPDVDLGALHTLRQGAWQVDHPSKLTKLRILSQNPISLIASNGDLPESYNVMAATLFCERTKREKTCVRLDQLPPRKPNSPEPAVFTANKFWHQNGITFRLVGEDGSFLPSSSGSGDLGLVIPSGESLEIYFNELTNYVELVLETYSKFVRVSYFKNLPTTDTDINNVPIYRYVQVKSPEYIASGDLAPKLVYEEANKPLDKIVIDALGCDELPPNHIDLIQDLKDLLQLLVDQGLFQVPMPIAIHPRNELKVLMPVFDLELFKNFKDEHWAYRAVVSNGDTWEIDFFMNKTEYFHIDFPSQDLGGFSITDMVAVYEIELRKTPYEETILPGIKFAPISFKAVVGFKKGSDPEVAVELEGVFRAEGRIGIVLPADQSGPTPSDGLLCGDLTIQAKDLVRFLNALIDNGDFEPMTTSLEKKDYFNTFWNTSLYSGQESDLDYTYEAEEGKYTLLLSDGKGYDCEIVLTPVESGSAPHPPIHERSGNQVVGFQNMRLNPDQQVEGTNYHFLIDAEMSDGSIKTFEGHSCYPVADCSKRPCVTLAHQVCYIKQTDYLYNEALPTEADIETDNLKMMEAINTTVQPIWRPNTTFAITFSVLDEMSWTTMKIPFLKQFVLFFKTAGGVGFFHQEWQNGVFTERADYKDLKNENNQDAFKYRNLIHYIDYPKCFPNADGRLHNAKPLYFGEPRLNLFFRHQYVYAMFTTWGNYNGLSEREYRLEVVIKDPASDADIQLGAKWKRFDFPMINQAMLTLNNVIHNGDPCSAVVEGKQFGIHPIFECPDLKPEKTYSAIFKSVFQAQYKDEIHQYVFETSRYRNFQEHMKSYRFTSLDEDGTEVVDTEAIYTIDGGVNSQTASGDLRETYPLNPTDWKPDASSIDLAQSVFSGNLPATDPLMQQFSHPYDRFFDGALKMGAVPPPTNSEFNIVRLGGRILGIWVRTPEPIVDPKTPKDVIFDAQEPVVQLTVGGQTDFNVLYSKDFANAFISNADGNMDMPIGTYQFTFRHILYNGKDYTPKEVVDDIAFDVQP